MNNNEILFEAARKIIKDAKENKHINNELRLPKSRQPDWGNLWLRYCYAVITPGTRISEEFWDRVDSNTKWAKISEGDYQNKPNVEHLKKILSDLNIRFPHNKANYICRAWEADFEALSESMRKILNRYHRKKIFSQEKLRSVELELCRLIQFELRNGCGIGPKVTRLMMIWDPAIDQAGFAFVIPIDIRWLNALNREGIILDNRLLSDEESYRGIEDIICEAAFAEELLPKEADRIVFNSDSATV